MASSCDAAILPVNSDEAARLQPTTHRLLHKHHRLFSAADKSADDPSTPHVQADKRLSGQGCPRRVLPDQNAE